jgi:solute:Na+ symporter, SSS family
MVDAAVGISIMVGVLAVFAFEGFRARGADVSTDDYMTARNSQSSRTLGLSFFASGVGAWILFAPPEVGAFVGIVGVIGYALGQALPLAVFAFVGPRMRAVAKEGKSLTEFVRLRFGRTFHVYVIFISVMYMAIFLTAELTGVGAIVGIIAGIDSWITILLMVAITLAYTAYGGLKASLRTDRLQAWLVIALVLIAVIAAFTSLDSPGAAIADSGLMTVDRVGIEVAVTLIIAIIAANMFHQGYWQRVWSARDDRHLIQGGAIGLGLTIPIMLLVGVMGILAVGGGLDLSDPPVPFFAVLAALPSWMGYVVIILGVALVASSVDTLENALASLVTAERPQLSVSAARVVTVVIMIPVVFVALQGYSILRLFLIADLLAAATVVPALLGLWRRATSSSAIAGAVAGLLGAIVPGWVTEGSLTEGVRLATFPGAIPTLPPFLWAAVASTVVTIVVALATGRDDAASDQPSEAASPTRSDV